MSHEIKLSDDVYNAVQGFAAQYQLTPEEVIRVWAQAASSSTGGATPGHAAGEDNRVDNPAHDPWAGYRGMTTLLSEDSLDRHDVYLAQEHTNEHEPAE